MIFQKNRKNIYCFKNMIIFDAKMFFDIRKKLQQRSTTFDDHSLDVRYKCLNRQHADMKHQIAELIN